MKHWKLASVTTAAVLAATLGAGLTARAATLEPAVRASSTALSVSLLGPRKASVGGWCSWAADVSGGTPPYSYQWATVHVVEGATTNDWFTTVFEQEGANLVKVVVTDAWGATAQFGVQVVGPNDPAEC